MHAALALRPGERVLEIGCGNGLMAFEMAESVSPSGAVSGVDISAEMVGMARRVCASLSNVEFTEANAIDLPFANGSFDVVTITQCLCLVPDVGQAVGEAARVLKSGGRAVILETDWDTLVWNSTDPLLMERVTGIYKAVYVDARLPRRLSKLLKKSGLEIRARDQFAILNWTFDPDTFSGHQIGFIRALADSNHLLSASEIDAWAQSIRDAGDVDEYFFSLDRYIFTAVKP